jgi:hypothetical protein
MQNVGNSFKDMQMYSETLYHNKHQKYGNFFLLLGPGSLCPNIIVKRMLTFLKQNVTKV